MWKWKGNVKAECMIFVLMSLVVISMQLVVAVKCNVYYIGWLTVNFIGFMYTIRNSVLDKVFTINSLKYVQKNWVI